MIALALALILVPLWPGGPFAPDEAPPASGRLRPEITRLDRVRPRYQNAAPPGGLVRVEAPSAATGLSTRLVDRRGRILSRGTSFRVADRWVSLLGVPATVSPGAYRLAIGVEDGDLRRWALAPFKVLDREFAAEVIPLSKALSTLRTAPDPRKTEEALEMARILSTADSSAVWEAGPFVLPASDSRRSAGFGDRREYRYDAGGTDLSYHAGLDLALPEGSPVSACGRGRVVFAGQRIITGGTVVLEHLPGLFSLYFHLSEVLVAAGQLLEKGELLGSAGMTGLATGPHLHWEVQVLGAALDPDLLVSFPLVPGVLVP